MAAEIRHGQCQPPGVGRGLEEHSDPETLGFPESLPFSLAVAFKDSFSKRRAECAICRTPRSPPCPHSCAGHGSEAGSSGPGEGGAPSLAPGPLWSGPWLLVLTAGQHHFTHFPDFSYGPNESILTAVKTVVRYSCHRYRFLCTKDPPFMGGLRNSRGDVPLPSQTSHRKQRVS